MVASSSFGRFIGPADNPRLFTPPRARGRNCASGLKLSAGAPILLTSGRRILAGKRRTSERVRGRGNTSMATMKIKDVLTTGEVAKICNVAPRTVSKWFDSGALHGYRIPGSKDR